ncbi:hypothetical protein FHT02_003908 [Sphingomonas xinjiangensis]|uniref:Uncharacterized protein n=1 Tax=Sphingomonas xinjiangensis TaxID=643568 RepID=A0A840YSJ7_9SPHN|nr:hypothetical protein [Sphingomonas xinjiangensis]
MSHCSYRTAHFDLFLSSVANVLTFECLVCRHLCDIGLALTVYVTGHLAGEGTAAKKSATKVLPRDSRSCVEVA